MPNGTYGGVRGRKTKVGRKLSFSSYSIVCVCAYGPSVAYIFFYSILPAWGLFAVHPSPFSSWGLTS